MAEVTISIITICFNNPDDLVRSCGSVDDQELKPLEHIIIDGSTTGEIKAWLEEHPQPPYRSWVCERDRGIAGAFNKGLRRAKGAVLLLLNSGDRLYDASVLGRVRKEFEADPSLMWCHGKLSMMRGGLWVNVGKPFDRELLYRGMRGTFHPTMYVRREVYEKHGLFDGALRYAMDFDFLCRIADEKHSFIDYPLAVFDPTGVSTKQYLKAMNEAYAVYRKYFGFSWKQKVWALRLSLLHRLLHTGAGKLLYRIKVWLHLENI